MQFGEIKSIHMVVQPPPPSISRPFSSSQTETVPVKPQLPTAPCPPARGPPLSFLSLWPWLHVSEITPYYVRLISHRIMSWSFLHVVACLRNENFFLRLSTIPLFVYTTFCWSLHLWTFELFPPLAGNKKNAAVDISVQITVGGPSFSSGHPHRSTVALSYGNSLCNFDTTVIRFWILILEWLKEM